MKIRSLLDMCIANGVLSIAEVNFMALEAASVGFGQLGRGHKAVSTESLSKTSNT